MVLLNLVFGVVSHPAQNGSTPGSMPAELAPALESIHGDKIFQHVRTLASDRFEGRAAGSHGEELTVDYIANELKEAGLQPGNPNGRFVQKVPLTGYKTTPAISVSVNGRAVRLSFMADFVHDLPRLVPQVNENISGIVFAGYGITASQFEWDDYKSTDVRNKLVLVLSGEPSRPDLKDPKKSDPAFFKGDIRTYYSTREFKYEQAQKRGAAGVLVITDPEKAQTYSLFQTFARMEGMALRDSSTARSLAIAGLITEKAAGRILSAADTAFADAATKADLPNTRAIVLNATGRISIRSQLRQIISHNVVAKVEGSDPVLKKEFVIYSAHWDHLGKDKNLAGDQIYNGANDNAAGVAQLIEVGRAFAALKKRPKRTVLFIATTAEEMGYLGARYYIRKPLYPISQTVAAINLDAGNLFGLTRDLGSTGYGNSTLDKALAEAAAMQGRTFVEASIDNGGMYFASDQIEFAKGGIPAVFPWSGVDYVGKSPGFGEKIWDEYIEKRYHQVTDEVMPYWEMSGAVEDARWMMIAGFLVANGTCRPEFLKGSEYPWIGKGK